MVLKISNIIKSIFYGINCIRKMIITIVSVFVIVGLLVGVMSWFFLHDLYQESRKEEYRILSNINEGTFRKLSNTEIYDDKDQLISEINATDFSYAKLNEISPLIQEGYIAVEDTRFKEHNGIDIIGITRAAIAYVKNRGHITQGGSTITQQVVKNTLLSQERTLSRKAVEILLAFDIEKKFTKADIMEFYLNSCYYGNGCYGVKSACRYYFGKTPMQVNPAEAALIIGMSNNPNNVNPVASKRLATKKRNQVLKKLLSSDVITKKEYSIARNTQIEAKQIERTKKTVTTYQSSYALHCATITLMQQEGFPFQYTFENKKEQNEYQTRYEEAYRATSAKIKAGGYKIYTSLDATAQKQLQHSIDHVLDKVSTKKQSNGKYLLQSAAISIDNKTGYVNAIVGGRGETDEYNRAFLSTRQSGSAIKPLIDYGPAFDTGEYYPSYQMDDKKIENGPKNAEDAYKGTVSLRYAIKDSINTVAYRLLQTIGVKKGLSYLDKMKFSSLSYLDNYNSAIAIGGFTKGVHVTDMGQGYAAIANDGVMRERTCIKRIEHVVNGVIYENKGEETRIYSSGAAYMLTDCMKEVFIQGGTGYGLKPKNQICAGKTGTTNSLRDGWFCGYNIDRTCVVWVGNDDNTIVKKNFGSMYAGKIWSNYMHRAGGGRKDFHVPKTISYRYVDDKGFQTAVKTDKSDLFIIKKVKIAKKQAMNWSLEKEKQTAEKALRELEDYSIQSLTDYLMGYEKIRNKAQDAIAAISDKEAQKPYLARLNQKIKALEDETKNWSDMDLSIAEYKAQKEKEKQKTLLKRQKIQNKKNKIKSEVAKCQQYITMIKDIDSYSDTVETLLTKAWNSLQNISDTSEKERMSLRYESARKHVERLKAEMENDNEG